MLHNSGPYGPGETPVNMTPPVNMPQIQSPLNSGHNLDNLEKIAQSMPQTPSGHYSLPDYSNYNHPSLDLSTQMSSFSSYQFPNFPPAYLPSNQPSIPNTSWQNGLLPMNLNAQSSQVQDDADFVQNSEKRSLNLTTNNYNKTTPTSVKHTVINVPQVPLRAFQDSHDVNYGLYNVNNDKINNYLLNFESNLNEGRTLNHTKVSRDLMNNTNESLHQYKEAIDNKMTAEIQEAEPHKILDDSKRRSLENTVRLIEDILINTVKNKEIQQQKEIKQQNKETKQHKKEIMQQTKEISHKKETPVQTNTSNKNPTSTTHTATENKSKHAKTNTTTTEHINSAQQQNSVVPTTEQNVEMKPEHITERVMIKIESLDTEIDTKLSSFDIKIEPLDADNVNPFQRDLNGCPRDVVHDEMIVDNEVSVNEAMGAIGNGLTTSYYECPNCNLLFNHPKRFLIHTKWHTFGLTNERRQEIIREREFIREQKKQARMQERRNLMEKQKANKNYNCKECDKIFWSKSSLKNHKQRNHPTRLRECSMCDFKVYGWLQMKTHTATHMIPECFKCPDCEKTFKHKHSLAKHQDTHKEKTVSCPHCPKLFGSENQMKTHQKVHERAVQGQTFTCADCGKGFYQRYSLTIHERSHRNEKPYLCTICDTYYATNSSLKRHLKVSHSSTKPFQCGVCKRCFNTENILHRHAVRVHTDSDLFTVQCDHCERKFLKLRDLRKHMVQEHQKRRRKKKKTSDSDEPLC